jgi:hypothetical protein
MAFWALTPCSLVVCPLIDPFPCLWSVSGSWNHPPPSHTVGLITALFTILANSWTHTLQPWWWRQNVTPKRRYTPTTLHGITKYKTIIYTFMKLWIVKQWFWTLDIFIDLTKRKYWKCLDKAFFKFEIIQFSKEFTALAAVGLKNSFHNKTSLKKIYIISWGEESGYGLDGRGIGVRFPAREDFSLLRRVQIGSGAYPVSIQRVPGAVSLKVKQQGREADHYI